MADHNNFKPSGHLISGPENGANDGAAYAGALEMAGHTGVHHYTRLARKYVWLGLALMLLGALGGVASVVLSSPIYKVRTMLEVQGINEAWLRNSFEVATSYES